MLVSVPPFSLDPGKSEDEIAECLGGVLVLGGRKIIFVEANTVAEQKYEKGKEKRQQRRKTSGVESLLKQAKQKEKEREAKKVKPRATVKWPWSEVTAYVSPSHLRSFLHHLISISVGALQITICDDSL